MNEWDHEFLIADDPRVLRAQAAMRVMMGLATSLKSLDGAAKLAPAAAKVALAWADALVKEIEWSP